MALTRHVNVADAIDAQDIPAFHQIADAILPVSSAQFLVLAATADLANERVFTPGAGLVATDGGAGSLYTLNVATADATIVINADSIQVGVIQNANIRSAAALSVIGRSANSTGTVADIAGTTNGHILRITAGVLGFGTGVGASIGGFTAGSVIFAGSSGTLTEDNANFFWNDTDNRLGIAQSVPVRALDVADPLSSFQMRIGHTHTSSVNYDVGRNLSTGLLHFYGNQTAANGYVFEGINREFFRAANNGDFSVTNLAGGTSEMVKASTAGILQRAVAGTDYLAPGGWTAGSVFFANGSGVFSQDNAAFFWDTTNKRLELRQTGAGYALRIGPTGGFAYDIRRNAGTGPMEFYGQQSGAIGYNFGGVDGDRLVISTTGTVTIGNLGGGTSALVLTSTAGLLSRATAGTDYTGIITLTAGAGMTGGGTTAANRTFNVIANADATIVVNADDIQAGVMQTANYAAGSVTFAKIEALTASHLLGRGSASAGSPESIILGTGLVMTSTTLSVTGMAPSDAQYLTLATNATLTVERVFTPGSGLAGTDAGAGSTYTLDNQVYTGKAGSPTWNGSSDANNLTIRANTSATGTMSLTATLIAVSGYQTINQGSPLSTAYLDADVVGSRENVRFKVAGTTISDNGGRAYFQVFPRSGVTVGSGVVDASQIWTTMYLESTTFTAASGSPVTFAATTFYIANAPVAAGGLTITNPYAMWVDDGRSRFDGDSSGYVFELPDLDTVTVNDPDKQLKVWVRGIGVRYIDLRQV